MTPDQQEKLFASLRKAHPTWSVQRLSGYVHGVNDEETQDKPTRSMRQRRDEYGIGYLVGFAVRRGSDVEHLTWFRFVGDLVKECRR